MQETQGRGPSGRAIFLASIVLFLGYVFALTAFICAHRMFWADELLGWSTISDASWNHALQSWNTAMDSGGQLYDLLFWIVSRYTGYHPHLLRYLCSLYIAAGAILWVWFLRRFYGVWPAVLSTGLVWFGSTEVMFHFAEARFYAPYLFSATLCVVIAVLVEERRLSLWAVIVLSLAGGILLIGTHLLGFGWVALIVAAQIVTGRWYAGKIVSVAAFALSSLVLLPARSIFKLASNSSGWWMQRPHLSDLTRYYLQIIKPGGAGPSRFLLSIAVALIILAGAVKLLRSRRSIAPPERLLLLILALFCLMPVAFYLVSQVRTPMFNGRYLLPVYTGIAGLLACALYELSGPLRQPGNAVRARWAVVAACAGVLAAHAAAMHSLFVAYSPFSDLDAMAAVPGNVPVLYQDLVQVQRMHLYRPEQASRFLFVIPAPFTADSNGYQPIKQGYWPFTAEEEAFLADHPHFVFIPTTWTHEIDLDTRLLHGSQWAAKRIGSLSMNNGGTLLPVYDITRR